MTTRRNFMGLLLGIAAQPVIPAVIPKPPQPKSSTALGLLAAEYDGDAVSLNDREYFNVWTTESDVTSSDPFNVLANSKQSELGEILFPVITIVR